MVFEDLSQPIQQANPRDWKIAPVIDRLLAAFFDVLIFSPFFSLLFSQILKKFEVRYYTSPESTEFLILLGILVIGVAAATVFAQTFFLLAFAYTPGKYVFKLRVVSLENPNGKLSAIQAFLRSGLWVIECFLFFIPFVEIFSHGKRQALHDRAASTMVVTLKKQGDEGPNPLEKYFVRNFLFVTVGLFTIWGLMMATQLYQLALRGEFKKQESEQEQFLCSAVSLFAEKGGNRLDLALARYLAKEVDEDCLLNEADFALWTDHSAQRAWAYFIKGMYYQFDQDKAKIYLQKTCEIDSEGEACDLAEALLGKNRSTTKSKNSLTARIFVIRELIAKGNYEQVQLRLLDLAKVSAKISQAFAAFTQVERTKALLALGKIEEAKGAYEVAWPHMPALARQNFSAWHCLEELDRKCENRQYSSCENLLQELTTSHFEEANAEAVIALIQESQCKKSHELNLLAFHDLFDADQALQKLASAMYRPANMSLDAQLRSLREVAFEAELDSTRFLQRRAMIALLESSRVKSDFEKGAELIEKALVRDWLWQKAAGVLLRTSFQAGYLQVAQRASKMVPANYAKNYNLEKMRQIALLNPKTDQGAVDQIRIPASGLLETLEEKK